MSEPRYSFTQPVCGICYGDMYPGRQPSRVLHAGAEECCACTQVTDEGIYVRVDPSTVAHPTNLKDAA